jgi:hypothetical protein
MKYIHLGCLKKWIDSRLVVKEKLNSIFYYWKFLGCELCKEKYPHRVNIDGEIKDLLVFDRPSIGSYLIVEALAKDD